MRENSLKAACRAGNFYRGLNFGRKKDSVVRVKTRQRGIWWAAKNEWGVYSVRVTIPINRYVPDAAAIDKIELVVDVERRNVRKTILKTHPWKID